jgi:import inner membrane translocase subunit TIM9
MQTEEAIRQTFKINERCFHDCVSSFRTKKLSKKEKTCITNCAGKFHKYSQRVVMRFTEASEGLAASSGEAAAQ